MSNIGAAPGPADQVDNRRLFAIVLPIMFSNALQPILSLADTYVIGQLARADAIAAVAFGGAVLGAVLWVFGFLRMGTTGMVAQARGAGDAPEAGRVFLRALLMGAGIGVLFILLQRPIIWLILTLAPASELVEDQAQTYMQIRIWAAPAVMMLFAIYGWLVAMERTAHVMWLSLFISVGNLLLSMLFVWEFGWDVAGAAWASLIAELVGLLLGLYFCRQAFLAGWWRQRHILFDFGKIKTMLAVNADIMIRTLLLVATFQALVFFGGAYGDAVLAANGILLQLLTLSAQSLDGFAAAAETLVGQAIGARNKHMLRRAVRISSVWAAGLAVLVSLLLWLFAIPIAQLLAKAPEVVAAARLYLPWLVAAPIIGVASWMLDGIFIGATHTRAMRHSAVLSTLAFLLVMLLSAAPLGNHGIWLAMMLSYISRAVVLAYHYPKILADAGAGGK